jgi:hypothetical protein
MGRASLQRFTLGALIRVRQALSVPPDYLGEKLNTDAADH